MSVLINKLFALIIFIMLIPVWLLIAIVIIIDDGFPILFCQKRIGRDNSNFTLYKFRTMKENTPDIPTHLLQNPKSFFTKSGSFLRKSSFDEIPQLINIIKGDMNFIGPRPALYNQLDLIHLRSEYGIDKLTPGITGWAQINGRDKLTIKEKVDFDKYYLNNKSFFLNVKILFNTLIHVLFRRNVTH